MASSEALDRRRRDAARETLLRHVHQRLEQALELAARHDAMAQSTVIAQLCVEAGRFAAVIEALG